MERATENALDAAVLRRLLEHLNSRKDAQNIELMILAGFCRNCLSKWYVEAAKALDVDFDLGAAQQRVYGMPYAEWKAKHQPDATPEQLERFDAAKKKEGK
jgi:hypothetical protein